MLPRQPPFLLLHPVMCPLYLLIRHILYYPVPDLLWTPLLLEFRRIYCRLFPLFLVFLHFLSERRH